MIPPPVIPSVANEVSEVEGPAKTIASRMRGSAGSTPRARGVHPERSLRRRRSRRAHHDKLSRCLKALVIPSVAVSAFVIPSVANEVSEVEGPAKTIASRMRGGAGSTPRSLRSRYAHHDKLSHYAHHDKLSHYAHHDELPHYAHHDNLSHYAHHDKRAVTRAERSCSNF
jgi:hypothetical protein